jgi:hypothetical protein
METGDIKMMQEELIEVVARASREAPLLRDGLKPDPEYILSPAEVLRAAAAITALCATLCIPSAALVALAKGEACVVPKEPTKDMLWAVDRAYFTGEDDPDKPEFVLFGQTIEEYRAAIAASPYVVQEGGV